MDSSDERHAYRECGLCSAGPGHSACGPPLAERACLVPILSRPPLRTNLERVSDKRG